VSYGTARQAILAEKKRLEEEKQATPSLTWTQPGEPSWALCGNVMRKRRWVVNDPDKRGGIIIQKVTRIFNVQVWDGTSNSWIDLTDIDTYVQNTVAKPHPAINPYWEAWDVDADGTVEFGGTDTFAVGSIIPNADHEGLTSADLANTTKGDITVIGEARFIPGLRRRDLRGMFEPQADHPAGVIPSTNTAPGSLTGGYEAAAYTLQVSWDSTRRLSATGVDETNCTTRIEQDG
jgi:hypothetical protein